MNASRIETAVRPPLETALISVVLPAFNEAGVLNELHDRVSSILERSCCRYEIIFVNDGSTDGSPRVLDTIAAHDANVRVLHLSRNFGHQAALQAGLEAARGDAVIVMDSDLQDDPRAIPEFLELWQSGVDVVYAIRHSRKEGLLKRLLFHAFYRLLNAAARVKMPMDAGNFGLLDRQVIQALARIADRDRYFPGLRSWVGYRQVGIPVERGRRYDETPRVSLSGLLRLAKTAFYSFTTVPVSAFYAVSLASLLLCLGMAAWTLSTGWSWGTATPAWALAAIIASGFGSLNALGIAVLGEYLVRIYDQVRGRPGYIVARETNPCREARRDREATTGPEEELLDWVAENWDLTNRHGTERGDEVLCEPREIRPGRAARG